MEAIFGLMGVIIGGLISGGVNLFLERRKERASARVAARIVREDLLQVALWIEDALAHGRWLQDATLEMNKKAWMDERARLASVMNYQDYAEVQMAQHVVDRLNSWMVRHHDQPDLDEASRKDFEHWLADLSKGLGRLLSMAK